MDQLLTQGINRINRKKAHVVHASAKIQLVRFISLESRTILETAYCGSHPSSLLRGKNVVPRSGRKYTSS
jgi:hypothetical protein